MDSDNDEREYKISHNGNRSILIASSEKEAVERFSRRKKFDRPVKLRGGSWEIRRGDTIYTVTVSEYE